MKLIVSLVFFSCFISVIGCKGDDSGGATNGGASGAVENGGAGGSDGLGNSGAAAAGSGVSGDQGVGDGGSNFETRDAGDASETVLACSCTTYSISWGEIGGTVAFSDRSMIAPCFKYTHQLVSYTSSPPSTATCEIDEPLCEYEAAIGGEQLTAAVQNAEVQSALLQGTVLYGHDSRPVDGQVFEIEVGENTIEVGSDCDTVDASCVPIPKGVQDLVDLLKKIDLQQFTEPGCPASMIRRSQ
jgi:hypothetical protein